MVLFQSLITTPSNYISLPPPAVYRPGEDGLYWYAVIAGNLEMLDVDPADSSNVGYTVNAINSNHTHPTYRPLQYATYGMGTLLERMLFSVLQGTTH